MTFPVLKKYRILHKVCNKFCFTVYEAESVVNHNYYFLKVLDASLSENSTNVSLFLQSARLTKLLNTNGICKVYTYDNENGLYYIVAEPVEYKPLSLYIHEAYPNTLEKATSIVLKIAKILRNAHIKCVLHGLLNPGCIYINDHNLKIDDFGFNWIIPRIDLEDAEAMYLSYYIAPEVYLHQNTIDGRADIYSLGAIFLQLLTEDFSFNGKIEVDVKNRFLLSTIPMVKNLFPKNAVLLEQILHKSLSEKPDNRYLNFKQFITDLEKLQPEVPAAVKSQIL